MAVKPGPRIYWVTVLTARKAPDCAFVRQVTSEVQCWTGRRAPKCTIITYMYAPYITDVIEKTDERFCGDSGSDEPDLPASRSSKESPIPFAIDHPVN